MWSSVYTLTITVNNQLSPHLTLRTKPPPSFSLISSDVLTYKLFFFLSGCDSDGGEAATPLTHDLNSRDALECLPAAARWPRPSKSLLFTHHMVSWYLSFSEAFQGWPQVWIFPESLCLTTKNYLIANMTSGPQPAEDAAQPLTLDLHHRARLNKWLNRMM